MEKKLIIEVSIEDKPITHFAFFNLQQQFNDHHYFKLRCTSEKSGKVTINGEKTFNVVSKAISKIGTERKYQH